MNSTNTVWIPDCTEKCKSTQHGDIITAAISKRSISDIDLCSYLNYICTCCESVRDSAGRTALHVAASCGRINLVRWLVQNRHANINAKDEESGYTALHRSIFYGKVDVAVELIKLGANITLQDSNSLTMLEHAMKDGNQPWDYKDQGGELFVWGCNSNNSLGPQQLKVTPELLDIFHKEHTDEVVKQVCVDKFHSIIVTSSGKVFSCGHGQGGRLGLGIEKTVITPSLVTLLDNHNEIVQCAKASISRDHSMFLGTDGNIYVCGLNTNKVLGLSGTIQQSLVPKQLKHLSEEISGICAGRYHCVAWGPKTLYSWGLNAGQIGHRRELKHVITPKFVTMLTLNETKIVDVAASDGATVLCTEKGDIYVLHEYQCRKIASKQLNIVSLCVVGGNLNTTIVPEMSTESNREVKVAVLTNSRNILLWQESDPQLCRCVFSINRAIDVMQLEINMNELLFVTIDGEAFKGVIKPRKKTAFMSGSGNTEKNSEKSAFHKFLEREDCIQVKLTKFPRIHRAVCIKSDSKGRDYCVIQALAYRYFSFPAISPSEIQQNFQLLLEETQNDDGIHDVTFKIQNQIFLAHKYLVSSKSPYLAQLLRNNNELVFSDLNPHVFEQFLKYVYTGTCELLFRGEIRSENLRKLCENHNDTKDGVQLITHENVDNKNLSAFEYYNTKHKSNKKSDRIQGNVKSKNPVRMLNEMAKMFECSDLHKLLSNLDVHKYCVRLKTDKCDERIRNLKFDRKLFPEFYDVTINCSDGRQVMAHKCVLVARLEYFNNLFSIRWGSTNSSEISLAFPRNIVEVLLDFLYTDNLPRLEGKDVEYLFKILILSDHLFVSRLKDQCEQHICELLTIKNTVQILTFAHMYNAEKLYKYTMKFISQNLTPFLELRSFDDLDESLLKEIAEYYYIENRKNLACRMITPYSAAVPDEDIMAISSMYPVSLDDEIAEKIAPKSNQKRRYRSGGKSSSSDKNNSISLENDASLDSIIQFPDIPEVEVSKNNSFNEVTNRLKTICIAQNKIKDEEIQLSFTPLNNRSQNLDNSFDSFPELSSPPSVSGSFSFSPKNSHKQDYSKHGRIVKMSQKQRKRLSSESSNNNQSPPAIEVTKNPWKVIPDVGSPSSYNELQCNMGDIISHEKKQKENLVKIQSKMLIHTQLEDKAIDELHKFYNTENVIEEIITIERVSIGAIAQPVWVPRNK